MRLEKSCVGIDVGIVCRQFVGNYSYIWQNVSTLCRDTFFHVHTCWGHFFATVHFSMTLFSNSTLSNDTFLQQYTFQWHYFSRVHFSMTLFSNNDTWISKLLALVMFTTKNLPLIYLLPNKSVKSVKSSQSSQVSQVKSSQSSQSSQVSQVSQVKSSQVKSSQVKSSQSSQVSK